MKKIYISILALSVFMLADNNSHVVYCDKLSLPDDKINSPHYKDCIQPTAKYTDDEIVAYKISDDRCTPKKLQAKKDAIKRLKKQDKWAQNSNLSEIENLAYSVPDYESWSANEVKKYKEAVKIVQRQNSTY